MCILRTPFSVYIYLTLQIYICTNKRHVKERARGILHGMHFYGALFHWFGAFVLGTASRVYFKSPYISDHTNFVVGMIIASSIAKLTNINVILHYRLIWRTKCQ